MKNESGYAMFQFSGSEGESSPKEESPGGFAWNTFQGAKFPVHAQAKGNHAAEIHRILRRQELAQKGFVFVCVAASVLIVIAIWFRLTS